MSVHGSLYNTIIRPMRIYMFDPRSSCCSVMHELGEWLN